MHNFTEEDITYRDYSILTHKNTASIINLALKQEHLNDPNYETEFSSPQFPKKYEFESLGHLFLDIDGHIIDINVAGTQILGMGSMRMIKRHIEQFVIKDDRIRFRLFLNQLLSGYNFATSEKFHMCVSEEAIIPICVRGLLMTSTNRKAPDSFLLTFTGIPEKSESSAEPTGTPSDSKETERHRNTETNTENSESVSREISMTGDLCVDHEKLRQLSHRTMAILENERKVIAREIHDSLGGSLAAIKFRLEDILSKNHDDPEIAESLNKTVGHLQDAIKKTKRISAGLRPTILDDLGLKATIKWCCRRLRESCPGISFVITLNMEEESIEEPLKIVIYRIIQEAMANAIKHSKADTIWLYLTQAVDRIEIEVKDNGCGFNTDMQLAPNCLETTGYGLTEIKEKTEICGGSFFIKSYEGEGTLLYVSLPLASY